MGPGGPISWSNVAKIFHAYEGLMSDVKISATGHPVRHDFSFQSNCSMVTTKTAKPPKPSATIRNHPKFIPTNHKLPGISYNQP